MSVSFGYLANIWPLPVVFSGYAEKTQKISYEPRFQDRCDYFPVFASKYIANISCGHGWLPIRCCLFIYCDDDDLDLGTEFIIIGLKVKALRSSNKVYQYDFLNMLIFTHFSDWRNYCTAWVDFYANLLFYLWNYFRSRKCSWSMVVAWGLCLQLFPWVDSVMILLDHFSTVSRWHIDLLSLNVLVEQFILLNVTTQFLL